MASFLSEWLNITHFSLSKQSSVCVCASVQFNIKFRGNDWAFIVILAVNLLITQSNILLVNWSSDYSSLQQMMLPLWAVAMIFSYHNQSSGSPTCENHFVTETNMFTSVLQGRREWEQKFARIVCLTSTCSYTSACKCSRQWGEILISI